jgi:hypothetical protein
MLCEVSSVQPDQTGLVLMSEGCCRVGVCVVSWCQCQGWADRLQLAVNGLQCAVCQSSISYCTMGTSVQLFDQLLVAPLQQHAQLLLQH